NIQGLQPAGKVRVGFMCRDQERPLLWAFLKENAVVVDPVRWCCWETLSRIWPDKAAGKYAKLGEAAAEEGEGYRSHGQLARDSLACFVIASRRARNTIVGGDRSVVRDATFHAPVADAIPALRLAAGKPLRGQLFARPDGDRRPQRGDQCRGSLAQQ